jgi:hypothetical protein
VAAVLIASLGITACATQQATAPAPVSSHYARPTSYAPPGPPHDPWGPWIREASRRFDIPDRWIREVMRQESGGRVGATSPVGAMGLMQVMPGTYRELRSRYGLGDDPYHPYDSIMAGTAYIREMYDLFGSPAFLAAYNAGPRRLEDYLWNSRGLPSETRNYIRRIGPNIVHHHPRRRAAPEVYAAAEIPLVIPAGPRRMDQGTMLALRQQRDATEPGIQVAQLPPGTVVRMEPIPDGSTDPRPSAPAYQVAAVGNVVRMDPIPDGSTYADPPPALAEPRIPGLASEAPGPAEPAASAPRGGSSLRTAALPPPSREAPPPARSASPLSRHAALTPQASRVPVTAPGRSGAARAPAVPSRQAIAAERRGFGLLGSAQASTLRPTARPVAPPATGGWAVQVGAFSTEAQARSAASRASSEMREGRVLVQPFVQGRSTLYRARVVGMSRPGAQATCDRLRARGGCAVLAPDRQG